MTSVKHSRKLGERMFVSLFETMRPFAEAKTQQQAQAREAAILADDRYYRLDLTHLVQHEVTQEEK